MNRYHSLLAALATGLLILGVPTKSVRAENVNWGPFHLNMQATAGFEYTDNLNASQTNPKSDFRLTLGPRIDGAFNTGIRMAGGEELTMAIGASYTSSYSTRTGTITESFSNPASVSLKLPIYFLIASWRIEVSDVFSYGTSILDTTYGVNNDRAQTINNALSVSAIRSFGKTSLALSAAWTKTINLTSSFSNLDQDQYQFSITPSYAINQYVSTFWRTSYFINNYNNTDSNNSNTNNTNNANNTSNNGNRRNSRGYSTEVGISGQITPSISGSTSVGWQHTELLPANTSITGGIFDGIYDKNTNGVDQIDGFISNVALNYTHPLRPHTTHSLALFHSPGLTGVLQNSDITQSTGATYTIVHQLNKQVTLSPHVTWIHLKSLSGTESISGNNQDVDIVNFGVSVSRRFSRKLSGSLSYLFQSRNSNIQDQSYDVNQVFGNLTYQF